MDNSVIGVALATLGERSWPPFVPSKSDADQDLVQAVECLAHGQPFVTSRVTEVVLESGPPGRQPSEDLQVGGQPATPREREILQRVAEGNSSNEIAAGLTISIKTVEAHRANLMRKLRVRSVSELVRYAIRNGVVEA